MQVQPVNQTRWSAKRKLEFRQCLLRAKACGNYQKQAGPMSREIAAQIRSINNADDCKAFHKVYDLAM